MLPRAPLLPQLHRRQWHQAWKSAPHTEICPTHRNLPHAARAKRPDRQHFQLGNPVRGESFDLNLGML